LIPGSEFLCLRNWKHELMIEQTNNSLFQIWKLRGVKEFQTRPLDKIEKKEKVAPRKKQ